MSDEALPQLAVVPLGVIAIGSDSIGRIVDSLAGAPEHALIGREPVVVEEGAPVRDALPIAPAKHGLLLRRSTAR
jgi:hypothetical protein